MIKRAVSTLETDPRVPFSRQADDRELPTQNMIRFRNNCTAPLPLSEPLSQDQPHLLCDQQGRSWTLLRPVLVEQEWTCFFARLALVEKEERLAPELTTPQNFADQLAPSLANVGSAEAALIWLCAPEVYQRCHAEIARRRSIFTEYGLRVPTHTDQDLDLGPLELDGQRVAFGERIRPNLSLESQQTPMEIDQALQAIESYLHLFEGVAALHQRSLWLGTLSPDQLGDCQGRVELLTYPPLHEGGRLPQISSLLPHTQLNYSAPELLGLLGGRCSVKTDVFTLGALLFRLLSGHEPFTETSTSLARHPSPRLYQPLLPPSLVSLIEDSMSCWLEHRPANAQEFLSRLRQAAKLSRARSEGHPATLKVSIAHERHVGVLKGQYNPINQDDLFVSYAPSIGLGLFLVADGVSTSDHGSGEQASAILREETAHCWSRISFLEAGESTLTGSASASAMGGLTLDPASITTGDGSLEGVQINAAQELVDLVNRANLRMADHINARYRGAITSPERVMATTSVLGLLEENVITLASLGDSRIYLIRDGWIVSLMNDDDLGTHLLLAGHTLSQVQETRSAGALVSCVGDFQLGEAGELIANELTPQLRRLPLLPGDQLLFCSDGLPNYSGPNEERAEKEILKTVSSAFSPQRAAFELIALANRGGGGDNLSCVLLSFQA